MKRWLRSDSARFFAWHARARQASPLRVNARQAGVRRTPLRRGGQRLILGVLAALGLLMTLSLVGATTARADGPHVDVVNFNREVNPPSRDFLTSAIDTAEHDGATTLVIMIDTPGGDLDSMWKIQEKMLGATIPLVTYVAPSGAHAASAGAVIALAAPIVAMAPDTAIGASSPVDSSGNNLQSTLDEKIKQDTIAKITAEQTTFGRNPDTAAQMVQNAKSYNEQQALTDKTINYVEPSLDALLAQIDGLPVTLANGTSLTLQTKGLPQQTLEPTLANDVQMLLFDPNVLFLIFILAALCIYLEISHPGAIVPGTIGAIALLLFLFTAGALQPNWAGLALMLLAIVLLAIDVRAPTHGVLTAGALISLVLGALIFFDTGTGANRAAPSLSPAVLLGVVLALALVSAGVIRFAIQAQRFPVKTGREGLLGERAKVVDPLSPEGRVRILGENWAARLAEPFAQAGKAVEAGREVRVVKVEGLTLIVEPLFALDQVGEGMLTWTS
jgi:membrane-bound serine protease (ClpP class)